MKLDDLKQDWQQTIKNESTPEKITEVINMIEQQTTKIDKEVKRRDFLEVGTSVILVPFWIWGLLNSASTMQREAVSEIGLFCSCPVIYSRAHIVV